ncbi:P-loop containing nucleoside triphosphate hydrolase protein [Echria macrotheca]|uniref:P-loop containing nucleoside triphosphate hydrolase protein n=1 Tax=Echria macrotheca TaxID=438768 RepID=A0AAJ0B4N8_9PEZI|nr:P-loop containing nucleoside triphosphate hydrolase protein [Echria macrotheca]
MESVASRCGSSPTQCSWKSQPELPDKTEILAPQPNRESLPNNPVDQPWASKDAYFETQYKILRCEGTEGLRFSVNNYRNACAKGPEPWDDDHTWIYPQVRVKAYLMAKLGPIVRVEFTTARSRFRINWLQSKRLIPGKLVAITTKADKFRTICYLATIAQRSYRDGLDQDPPQVDLIWANPADAILDPSAEMVMIESRHGYFEASRHALAGLQEVSETDSPLIKYLIGKHRADGTPDFINKVPIMDLSSLAHRAQMPQAQARALKTHNIIASGMPPIESITSLDSSQVEGLHRILSQELAIVQGPPGTGKTFTSIEAIKVMVSTRRRTSGPPIIVAAQTNHALDHMLSLCLNAGVKILRVGGRTTSPEVGEHTLFKARLRPVNQSRLHKVEKARRQVINAIKSLVDGVFGDHLLEPKLLRKFGVITEKQCESLCDDTMELAARFQKLGRFHLWLGDSLVPVEAVRSPHHVPPEPEEPLPEEFEVEGDPQNVAEDEEDEERIKGVLIDIEHRWTGRNPYFLVRWDGVAERTLAANDDLFEIRRDLRGLVYQLLQARFLAAVRPKFAELLAEYSDLCARSKAIRQELDAALANRDRVDVVGCTTTGLTKYRALLSALSPRSLLIEEAAETREANIVSALYPTIQQLILIGDHQQLAPSCDIRWLGSRPFNLDVSLFQRMINLKMPYTMLKVQRRMKPELRQILKPFYPELTDHVLVLDKKNRPDVPGMGGRNCWFFNHDWPEDTNSDHSKYNEQEAQMVTGFFAYLVANGVPSGKITVLTFYTGQRKVLASSLRRHGSLVGSEFKVCTVDSYQGEENDVVILSMVRSPYPGGKASVGFLEDRRRAVVAISRARRGFYIFGNIDNTLKAGAECYELWFNIWNGFHRQKMTGMQRLPIECQNHARILDVREPEDWSDNAGGCHMYCKQLRPCGHRCTLRCHPSSHDHLGCGQPCLKVLDCGHGCQRLCSQDCACSCEMFKKFQVQLEAANPKLSGELAEDELPLEQLLLRSGVPPSSMIQAEIDRRNRSAPVQQLPAPKSGGRPIPPGHSNRHTRPTASVKAVWKEFVDNIEEHDERLRQERENVLAAPGSSLEGGDQTTPSIRDVYRQTNTVDGRRVEEATKDIREIDITRSLVDTPVSLLDTDESELVTIFDSALSLESSSVDLLSADDGCFVGMSTTTPSPPHSRQIWVEHPGHLAPSRPTMASTPPPALATVSTTPEPARDSRDEEEWLIDL